MSHVITAVTPDDAPDLSAGPTNTAKPNRCSSKRRVAANAGDSASLPPRCQRSSRPRVSRGPCGRSVEPTSPSDLGPTRVLDGVPDLFGESSARLVVGPTARRRRDGLFHVEALEQWSRVHGRARDGARIQYLDLGLRGSVVQRVHHQSDQDRRRERTRGVRAAGHWGYRELAGFDVSSGQRERHPRGARRNHSLIGAVALRTAVCTVTKSMHTQSASLNPSGL